jgi:hypothetical protein
MKSKRQSNIELLRIFSMLLIIGHHLSVHGIAHSLSPNKERRNKWYNGNKINKLIFIYLIPGGNIGVGIFFIITGYFNIHKNKINLFSIIYTSLFYGLFTSLGALYLVNHFGVKFYDNTKSEYLYRINILKFHPISGDVYWFMSIYVFIISFSPVLNKFLRKLNKLGFTLFLLFFWKFWYAYTFYYQIKYRDLVRGIMYYIIGAYIKLHFKTLSCYCNFINLILCVISYKYAIKWTEINPEYNYYFAIPISATLIFRFFEGINIGHSKIINEIASTTLAVYLIHDSIAFRDIIWNSIFKIDNLFQKKKFPIFAFSIILLIFFVCSIIDYLQKKIIQPISFKIIGTISCFLKNKLYIKE